MQKKTFETLAQESDTPLSSLTAQENLAGIENVFGAPTTATVDVSSYVPLGLDGTVSTASSSWYDGTTELEIVDWQEGTPSQNSGIAKLLLIAVGLSFFGMSVGGTIADGTGVSGLIGSSPCSSNQETCSSNPTAKPPPVCCKALTAQCLACEAGLTEAKYCAIHPGTPGCKPPRYSPCD